MKKFLSLILALIMVLSATAVVFSAAGNTAAVSLYDIKGNLITTKTYTVGETFEVTVYLNTSRIGTIGSLKADQTYSSDVLKLADEYKESSGMISDLPAMFPVTKNKTTANGKLDGKISYNASTPDFDPDAFPFDSDDAKLIVSHYTVIAPGNASINNSITTLAYADEMLTRIIDKGVIKIDNFSMRYTLSDPEPVEPTEAPTVKPTAAPTAKPTAAPTSKPTAAPTVKPTAAPTVRPTNPPTVRPTNPPTVRPTNPPTTRPTQPPTVKPTAAPTTRPTQPARYILGDANGDSRIDMRDPTYIRRYSAKIATGLSDATLMHGDVDNNGRLEILDATYIQMYLADMSVRYRIGELV